MTLNDLLLPLPSTPHPQGFSPVNIFDVKDDDKVKMKRSEPCAHMQFRPQPRKVEYKSAKLLHWMKWAIKHA